MWLKFPLLIDVKDVEVNILHIDLEGVLVGKEYFRINHMLLLSYNIGFLRTLLDKRVVPRPSFKEFLLRCLE